jgi:hypothetical protein
MTAVRRSRVVPGDGLLHPVVLAALVVLIANDQVLKRAWPGLVTGKLSDVAGLIVAPVALVAAWEIARRAAGRSWGPSRTALSTACVLVAVVFTATQVWPPATEALRLGLGLLQWPFRGLVSLASGSVISGPVPVASVADIGDLVALPALILAWFVGRGRWADGAVREAP